MSDGKDLIRVELTFHKVLPTNRYKKRAESRRLSAPSTGEWSRQPASAARPTRRQMPVRRPRPCQEKETSPPSAQTLPDTPKHHITHGRTEKIATIQPSPIITRLPPATSTSPISPPKKTRTQSLSAPASKKKNRTRYNFYPLHEKNKTRFTVITLIIPTDRPE